MLAFQRFPVTVTHKERTVTTAGYDTENTVTLISGALMCIERMPYNKVFNILGEQKNAKATYALYLEIPDPNIPQQADVEWEMHGQVYKGKVKFVQPYSQIVMNRKAEVYIQSDNQ